MRPYRNEPRKFKLHRGRVRQMENSARRTRDLLSQGKAQYEPPVWDPTHPAQQLTEEEGRTLFRLACEQDRLLTNRIYRLEPEQLHRSQTPLERAEWERARAQQDVLVGVIEKWQDIAWGVSEGNVKR